MNKIYVAHPYGGIEANRKIVEKIIRHIRDNFERDTMIVSPIHLFGHAYNEISYEKGIEMCLTALAGCNCLWIPDDFTYIEKSKGCLMELAFAKGRGIKIVKYPVAIFLKEV